MHVVTFESSAAHFEALTYTKMCCTGLECGQILTLVCAVVQRVRISEAVLYKCLQQNKRITSAVLPVALPPISTMCTFTLGVLM